jgi:adenine-specific DNA-methyltransferase
MNLTDREKEMIKGMIDRGEPLPPRYRLSLFADAPEVELIWQGKTNELTNVVLPFQSIEQIDEPRSEGVEQQLGMFGLDATSGRQSAGWTNKLIWGDNKLVLSSLKNGPLRREIEAAGGLKLIYIDPPFDVGADFSIDIEVGEGAAVTKEPSVIEEVAYRDTWGKGTDSYLSMMFERLASMRDLLTTDGSIFVHADYHVGHYLKVLLDEIFGADRFLNEVIWYYYNKFQGNVNRFASNHDVIFWYSNSASYAFSPIKEKRPEGTVKQIKRKWDQSAGRIVNVKGDDGKVVYQETDERTVDDVWRISMLQPADKTENMGYATQKPEAVLQRIVEAATHDGDLVADFFCGAGTTLAVAEKLGRKWIGCDLGRFAVHTSRKRLIGVQRRLRAEGKPYRAFEILNLGKYERQYFIGIDPALSDDEQIAQAVLREEQFLSLILTAYKAERVYQMPHIHGRKGSTLVQVGPIDAPVTLADVNALVEECRRQRIPSVDILAFEFEMGLHPFIQDEARQKGVTIGLKHIPKDVFDKRAVERGQVQFFDVAYVEACPAVDGLKATVTLTDFSVFYGQDEGEAQAAALKPGGTKVVVHNGQVVKLSKDKQGDVTSEVLTKQWTDWIDYWAVDFDFESKPEIIRLVEAEGAEREVRTGNYIFENEWQSFRTKRNRHLELTSAEHMYRAPGTYRIAIKVIDIFGNDTTKVLPVEVGG